MRGRLWIILPVYISALLIIAGCGGSNSSTTATTPAPGPTPTSPQPAPTPTSPAPAAAPTVITQDVATGLRVPWEMVFAPDGRMFFTEQPGRLRVIAANGTLVSTPMLDYTDRVPGGESGMLGLEIDRNFGSNGFLYIYYCYRSATTSTGLRCRVARLVVSGNTATENLTLLDFVGAEFGQHHYGGRIKIGPDGLLYVTVGDMSSRDLAQDLSTINGKILRLTLTGAAAPGNPFAQNPMVYSYGHRNPQGLAFDSSGTLYETEHGEVSHDELNIIRAGGNYGWPTCEGMCGNPQFVDPIRVYDPETAAPSGATFYSGSAIPQWTGSLLFATLGLAGNNFAEHVHRVQFAGPGSASIVAEEALFRGQFGRIRDVVQGPDGFLYFSTSNDDGNDRIVRIRPQ